MNSVRRTTGTRIDEVADGLFRIHTPDTTTLGGFSFNQYLLRDERSLLFHTGPRSLFPQIPDAIITVLPLAKLHYIGFFVLQRLAALQPRILACMHGSAWRGDGAQLLTSLARALA